MMVAQNFTLAGDLVGGKRFYQWLINTLLALEDEEVEACLAAALGSDRICIDLHLDAGCDSAVFSIGARVHRPPGPYPSDTNSRIPFRPFSVPGKERSWLTQASAP